MELSALESISKALEKSLDFWGLMLLFFTALVVVGLVVEYWHDVQEFWTRLTWPMASFPWDKFTALAGGILVTIGVAGELLVTYKASLVETQLRENSHKIETLLTQEAGDAATSAKTAHDEADSVKGIADEARADAKDALAKAQAAQHSLAQAESDAAKAQAISSNALGKATEAESHLKDAMQLGREATAELKRVTSPRTLNQYSKLADSLKPFKDIEYVFSGVSGDRESIDFLLKVDELLKDAGWKRGKPVAGFPGINPRGKVEPDFSVPQSLTVGVQITVGSPLSDKQLQSIPFPMGPKQVRAAVALNTLLFGNTLPTPRPTDAQPVVVDVGESTQVRIDVGKKP
ncbi:MAG TPA: hypothetical protein VKF84_06980 [Candidatus Sulfotelmatobacter sp.]|nr:hypothetical protein [Candidatus Sulfotelmatobacter sp.]